jgi:hypothetical protein
MNEYSPLQPGCACFDCWGCNKLELATFTGLDYCTGSDNEDKRINRKVEQLIEQCRFDIAEMTNRMRL